jgi:salicylate hydroxylase/6-hydroxynicotinate 3-monooxygenase
VREILLGPEKPKFTGRVAHRTVFPASLMGIRRRFLHQVVGSGPAHRRLSRELAAGRDLLRHQRADPTGTWSPGRRAARWEVRQALAGFHEDVQRLLAACPGVHKWALFERDPLPRWTEGPIVLLGDACHPMTPYMAQGAANALEDAAVLSRCLREVDDPGRAVPSYEATRLERTARIQLTSRQNTWGGRTPIRAGSTATGRPADGPLARPAIQAAG